MQPLRPLDFSEDDDAPEVRERPDLLDKIQARLLRLSTDELRLVADGLPDYVESMQSADELVQLVKDNVVDIKQFQASPNLRTHLIGAMDAFEFSIGRLLRKKMDIGVDVATWLSRLKSLPSTSIAKVDQTTPRYTSTVNRNGNVYAGWDHNDVSGVIPATGVVADGPRSGWFHGQAQGPRVVVGNMHQPADGVQIPPPGIVGYASYSAFLPDNVRGDMPADIATITRGTGTGAVEPTNSRLAEILHNAQQIADLARLSNEGPDAGPAPVTFQESDVGPWTAFIEDEDDDND